MTESTPHAPATSAQPPGTRRWRWLLPLAAVIFTLAGAALTALALVMSTAAGTRWAVDRVLAAQAGLLQIDALEGSAWRGLSAARIRWTGSAVSMEATHVRLRLDWSSLLRWTPILDELRAETLTVSLPASDSPPVLPATLRLPFDWQVRTLGIESIQWRQAGAEVLQLGPLGLSAAYAAGTYLVERLEVRGWDQRLSQGRLMLRDTAPFELRAAARLTVEPGRIVGLEPAVRERLSGEALTADVELEGALVELRVAARASYAGANARADWTIEPFAGRFDRTLEARLEGVDPARWFAGAPIGAVSASLRWRPAQAAVEFELSNEASGRLDQQRLPIERASGELSWRGGAVSVAGLALELPEGGRVAGGVRIDAARRLRVLSHDVPVIDAQLTLQDVDPSVLMAGWPKARLAAQLQVAGDRLRLEWPDVLGDRSLALGAEMRVVGERLLIERLQASLPSARAWLAGSIGLAGAHPFAVDGSLDGVNPRRLLERLGLEAPAQASGALNGDVRVRGELGGRSPHADSRLVLHDSRLAGQRLGVSMTASYRHEPRRLALDGQIEWGGNALQVRGAVGDATDRLRFAARIDRPDLLDRRLAGRLRIEADLVGPPEGPRLSVRLSAPALRFAEVLSFDDGEVSVEAADLRALARSFRETASSDAVNSDASSESPPMRVRLAAREVRAAGQRLQAVRLATAGGLDLHTFSASLRVAGQTLSATGQAEARPWRWSARLDALNVDGAVSARLQGPTLLDVAPGSLRVRDLALGSDGGVLALDELVWEAAGVSLRGEARALSLRPLIDWLEAAPLASASAAPPARGSVSDARIDAADRIRSLRLDARWVLSGPDLDALDGELSAALRTDQSRVMGGRSGDRQSGGARIDDPVIGDNRVDIRLTGGRLDGIANLAIPSLRFSRRYTAPDWTLDGELLFSGRVRGRLRSPELFGALRAERLTLFNRSLGWRLREGRIEARFDGKELAIDTIRFASGDGAVTVAGALRLSDRPVDRKRTPGAELPVEGRLQLEARRLPVPLGPGQRLLLSGITELVATGGELTWRGRLRADEGLIELRSGGVPELPGDVRVVGDTAPAVPRTADAGSGAPSGWTPRVGADLAIELGDSLRVRGGGVDARLGGELTLAGMLPSAPRVRGLVDVREGTFSAYGRRLEITRGLIRFTGELDNPVLDIVAMRREQQVEAGVAVTGSALAPRIRLVSEPDLPDAQKLSWLVLGAALDDVSNAGQARALSEAALALLGRNDEGLVASLTQRLGIDAVSVGASGAGARDRLGTARLAPPVPGSTSTASASAAAVAGAARQDVVTVSKRLSSRLTLSYERGLSGLWNLVRLQYDISNRLSLRAQSGSENALDLLYFWWFD